MHHPTDRITHTTAFVTPVVEHWLEWEIAQRVHPMKDRSDDPSHHEQMLYLWATSHSRLKDIRNRESAADILSWSNVDVSAVSMSRTANIAISSSSAFSFFVLLEFRSWVFLPPQTPRSGADRLFRPKVFLSLFWVVTRCFSWYCHMLDSL